MLGEAKDIVECGGVTRDSCGSTFLVDDFDSHATCGSLDQTASMIQIACVKVRHLFLTDIIDLGDRYFAHLVTVGYAGTFRDTRCLLQERGGGWTLGDEVKRSIVVDTDDDWNRSATVFLGSIVELLNELTKVDTEFT